MCQDQPDDADEYSISIELGDVIVSATDGLFDNLFNHEIHTIIKVYKDEQYQQRIKRIQPNNTDSETDLPCMLNTHQQAKELAERIVKAARAKVDAGARNERVKTPYERKYKKTYNATWDGGKDDDITAVVTLVIRES